MQDSKSTPTMLPKSPGLRPRRKRKLHGEMQNFAFGLLLLPGTAPRGKGFTKVAEQKQNMHDSSLRPPEQLLETKTKLAMMVPTLPGTALGEKSSFMEK